MSRTPSGADGERLGYYSAIVKEYIACQPRKRLRTGGQLQVIVRQSREFDQVPQQSGLEGLIAVNWNGKPHHAFLLAINVMTASDPKQPPTLPFNSFGEVLAGYLLHTAISRTR